METIYEEEINYAQQLFTNEVDKLCSKKRNERISALKQLQKLFYCSFSQFSTSDYEETLKEGLKLGLKGMDEEKEYALKTMIGLSLYMGTSSSSLLSYYAPALSKFFSPSVPSHLFSLALEAKTTLLFVGGDLKDTEEFLEFLYDYLDRSEDDHSISHLILRCYSLLLSTLPSSKISNYFLPFHIGKIYEVIRETEDPQLLLTAGETIALILSSHRAHSLNEKGEEGELEELDGFIDVNDFLEILDAKYHSSSDRNFTRNLRQVYKSIIDNKSPNIDSPIKIKSTSIKLNDWARMMQMRFFREILQGSLYLHLCENDLFAEIFDYDLFEDHSNRLKPQELALQRKENEKNRDNERRSAIKHSLKNFSSSDYANSRDE